MDEDKRVKPEVVEIDDFEFDDEFVDLFDQLGDILSTEAKESGTVDESQVVAKPNEPTIQNVLVESQVLAEVTKNSDITSLAKSVFDALQTMKQTQSVAVAENSVQNDETAAVKDIETNPITALDHDFVYQPDIGADEFYKKLKEKYRKPMKRHRKMKGTSHKGKKSRGHKISSDEYKRYKLMKQISLLDSALERKRLEERGRGEETQLHERSSEFKRKPHRRSEHKQRSSHAENGEEFYEGLWKNYVEPPTVITSFDLRNKLRLSSNAKRAEGNLNQSRHDVDRAECNESKRDKYDGADKKLNKSKTHGNYGSEELKSSKDSGTSKVRSVWVSSSDDVMKKDQDLAKEDVEPVSSSTSVKKKVNKIGSRHSSTSSANTISIVHMDSTESEIITSVDGIIPVKKNKKRKKTSKTKLKKKSKTENKSLKINVKDELKTSCAVLEETKNCIKSPQTYEVFDIAPFESSNLDIEIISENIISQTVDTTQCGNTKQERETPLIVLDSPGRDSIDSITSAKTVHRSRSVESIAPNEYETTEALDKIKESPYPSSLSREKGREKSPANSEMVSLSDVSLSPLLSESSLSKVLLRKENCLLELQSRKPSRSVHSGEDPNDDLSQSPHSTNGSLPSSPPSPTRTVPLSPQRREKLNSSRRGNSSDKTRSTSRDRKDVARYREKWRDSPTARKPYHYQTSKSPSRTRSRTPPRNLSHYRHRENSGTSTSFSYYRKRTRSRSPHYKRRRSPYRNRSRSRSHERYKTLRQPYRKRSKSKSPYRRKPSRSPYRKRSTSPCKLRKSRSPYKMSVRTRSAYRRSLSISPVRKIRRSKSPLQKRFEAAVANFLPQLEKKAAIPPTSSAKAPMDGYAANTTSFTVTATTVQQTYNHGPPVQHNDPYPYPVLQQPLSYGPPISGNYPGAAPPASYPTYNNLKWTCPPRPVHPPMLQMPYNCQMPLLPPGVAPYPNAAQQPSMPSPSFPLPAPVPNQPPMMPTMPAQNISFPLPIPMPNQRPMMPPQNTSFPLPAPVFNQPPMMPTMPAQNISFPLPIPVPNQRPMIPPQNTSFALPVPVPNQPPTIPPPVSVVVEPPDVGGQVVSATSDLGITCATSQIPTTEPSDEQLDLYSPSNSPPSSPVKYQSPFSSRTLTANSPSIRTDLTEFMTESLRDGIPVMKQRTSSYSKEIMHSPIILRLKRNLASLISSKSPDLGNSNRTPTVGDPNSLVTLNQQVSDKLIPGSSENSSKSLAIPVVGTVSKVVKKISFPIKENILKTNVANTAFDLSDTDELASPNNNKASTSAVDKPNDSIAIPVASRHRTSNNLLNKNKNKCVSSNRIIIATTNFPCQTIKKPEVVQTNMPNNSPSLTQSQVLEQVIKLLSISKRNACTQVAFIDNSLQGSDEVFEVKMDDHENLLNNLTRLLK